MRIGARDMTDENAMRRWRGMEQQWQVRDLRLADGRCDQRRERIVANDPRDGVVITRGERRRQVDAHDLTSTAA